MHTKLVQAEERRAIAAEKDAEGAKEQVENLLQQVESGRVELEEVKRKAREAASQENVDVEGEVVVLRVRLEELEGENSRLQHRARDLMQRYKDGDLVRICAFILRRHPLICILERLGEELCELFDADVSVDSRAGHRGQRERASEGLSESSS